MNFNELNNFDSHNSNYNNWDRIYNLVGHLLNNYYNNNDNDILHFGPIQDRFDILEQNDLFALGDFRGIHHYLNTGQNNWNILPNNQKLLMLETYKEIALLMWH